MTMGGAFWEVANGIGTPAGMTTQLATIQAFNNSELSDAIDTFNIILDKIYYFIPADVFIPLLAIVIASITIRIVMSIVNLIWW